MRHVLLATILISMISSVVSARHPLEREYKTLAKSGSFALKQVVEEPDPFLEDSNGRCFISNRPPLNASHHGKMFSLDLPYDVEKTYLTMQKEAFFSPKLEVRFRFRLDESDIKEFTHTVTKPETKKLQGHFFSSPKGINGFLV